MYKLGLTDDAMVDVRVSLDGNVYTPAPVKSIMHNYKRQTLVQKGVVFHTWSGTFICDDQDELDFLKTAYEQRTVWFQDSTGAGPTDPVQVVWVSGGLIRPDNPDSDIARVSFQMSSVNAD